MSPAYDTQRSLLRRFKLSDFVPGQPAGMRNLFNWMVWLLVFVVPVLSMGLIAQEWATGTIETLMTAPVNETDVTTRNDRIIDRTAVWRAFADAGRQKIAATNHLTIEENDELLRTPVVERAIELVLIGLSRIQLP